MNWLLRKLSFWAAFRVFASYWPPKSTDEPEWTDSDRKAWEGFLKTPTGQRLAHGMQYWEQRRNAAAVAGKSDRDFGNGQAYGFRSCCAWLFSLSANVPPHPDDHGTDPDGAEAEAERHAP